MTRRRISIHLHPWAWKIPLLYLTAIEFLGGLTSIWHLWSPLADPSLGPIWQRQLVVGSLMLIGIIWLPRPQRGMRR